MWQPDYWGDVGLKAEEGPSGQGCGEIRAMDFRVEPREGAPGWDPAEPARFAVLSPEDRCRVLEPRAPTALPAHLQL